MDTVHTLARKKTLLVEDDQLIRNALQMAFVKKGCPLQTAESAEEGLRALEKESFDIIISDFRLPGIDGLEFFKQAVICQPDTVKVLISAFADADVITRAYGIGVHFFLQKPFTFMTLLKTLTQQLEKHDHNNEPAAETQIENKMNVEEKSNTPAANWGSINPCTDCRMG
jgi:DNA-binding NtrC family response regulator